MKKILMSAAITIVGSMVISNSAGATELTNTAMTTTQYNAIFDFGWQASPTSISGTFDFGNNGTVDGVVYSGVEKSKVEVGGKYLYSYFYSVEMYDTIDNHWLSAFSVDFGTNPYAIDLDGDTDLDTSFWGQGDGWNTFYTDVDNDPASVSYNPSAGVVSVSYGDGHQIWEGEQSSWFMLISDKEYGVTTFNVINGGNGDVAGVVYAPVPEPATMLLFGTGLLGLAGVSRRRKGAK